MKKQLLLHYQALRQFNDVFYKDHLTEEHLIQGKKHFSSITFKNGLKDKDANLWAWELFKNNLSYLVDLGDEMPQEVLPIEVTDSEEIANGGNAYQFVKEYREVRLSAEKKMSFRELVDTFSSHSHTNPKHKKLLTLLALCNYFNRSFFRVCSPPSAGKDSAVATLRDLVGRCYTLNNPSAAKLSLRTSAKWLVISEVANIEKKDWRIISQFLLEAADNRTTIEKPTRAFDGVGETLDVSKLSIGVFYNDFQTYEEVDSYFDNIVSRATRDRFCPMRVYGEHTEDWNELHKLNYREEVDASHDFYKDLIYTINFYEENFESELSRYNHDLLYRLTTNLSNRHKTSLTHLLNTIDLYCESQEEFDAWIVVIAEAIQDYHDMLLYDGIAKVAQTKLRKEWKAIDEHLRTLKTYSGKVKFIKEQMNKDNKEESKHEDIKIW